IEEATDLGKAHGQENKGRHVQLVEIHAAIKPGVNPWQRGNLHQHVGYRIAVEINRKPDSYADEKGPEDPGFDQMVAALVGLNRRRRFMMSSSALGGRGFCGQMISTWLCRPSLGIEIVF